MVKKKLIVKPILDGIMEVGLVEVVGSHRLSRVAVWSWRRFVIVAIGKGIQVGWLLSVVSEVMRKLAG